MNRTLSSLSRGNGYKGQVYDNHRIHYLKKIPYTLDDLRKRKISTKNVTNLKYKNLPGTYLTERGQMILYTKASKAKGLNQETAMICKTFSNLYDNIQYITPLIKDENKNEIKNELRLGDLSTAMASLKNNWFFPKQWKSDAKVLYPQEMHNLRTDLKSFTKSKEVKPIEFNSSNRENIQKFLKNFKKYKHRKKLPKLIFNNMDYINQQKQNNAFENDNSPSKNGILEDISQKNDGDDSCYEADDELVIYPNNEKLRGRNVNDESVGNDNIEKMTIADVFGNDLILNDFKTLEPDFTTLMTSNFKSQSNEELRINLLKDLYGKLKFLSLIKIQLKSFGENLLSQFLKFNNKNKKLRNKKSRELLFNKLKDMRGRNDEIHLRLQKLSEKRLNERKSEMTNFDFLKNWDTMLLELSTKSKMDNAQLGKRIEKIIVNEEIKMNENECDQMQVEQSSIKYAFMKLKEEFLKLDEKKNEIEHFIIRLEMKREKIDKIDKEIQTSTSDLNKFDSENVNSLIRNMKDEMIIMWKSKMGEMGDKFKFNELNSKRNINLDLDMSNSLPREKGDSSRLMEDNAKLTELKTNEESSQRNFEEESETSIQNHKTFLTKLDYENIKHSQRISSNYTFSYFIPWKIERYEGLCKPPPSTDEDSFEEVKPNVCKLNYKRILANNPLLKKKQRFNKFRVNNFAS